MAKVSLISYTGQGTGDRLYAARLLAYTKNTRMSLTPTGLADFMTKPEAEILAELKYMATSIPSSWEFADLTFSIEGISRATAQQVTRTRAASYAMQSQRVTNMSDVGWDNRGPYFDDKMRHAIGNYAEAVKSAGNSLEDARDLLPIGVHCNLLAKYNFRIWVELVIARDSLRVQDAYRDIISQMQKEVLDVWPWAEYFLERRADISIRLIEEVAEKIAALEKEKGAMYKGLSGQLAKAADLLKK